MQPRSTQSSPRFGALALVLVAMLALCDCSNRPNPTTAPLNILFISCDTLRADHVGAYGYGPTSPAIDRLAKQAVVFGRAYAQRSQTWPSLTSVVTSKYPVIHGVRTNGLMLDEKHESLAEYLQGYNYSTAAFLGNMSRAAHRGYDVFASTEGESGGQFGRDRKIAEQSIEWLRENQDGPFFLWAHFMNPHGPYSPPEPLARRFYDGPPGRFSGSRPNLEKIAIDKIELTEADLATMIAAYDGDVVCSDSCVAMVLDELTRLGLDDNTVVVFFSDHGDELYDHNYYFMHSCSVYESVLNVPLIIRAPNRIPRGTVVDEIVELIDIAPTACALAGIDIPGWAQGTDLTAIANGEPSRGKAVSEWHPPMSPSRKTRDALQGKSPAEVKAIMKEIGIDRDNLQKGDLRDGYGMTFEEGRQPIYIVRTNHFRFILNHGNETPNDGVYNWNEGTGFPVDREELYDHRVDPREQENIVFSLEREAGELRTWLLDWSDLMEQSADLGSIPQDEETLQRLHDLGYINIEGLPKNPQEDH